MFLFPGEKFLGNNSCFRGIGVSYFSEKEPGVKSEGDADVPDDVLNSNAQSFLSVSADALPGAKEACERDDSLQEEPDIVGVVLEDRPELDTEEVDFLVNAADGGSLLETAPVFSRDDARVVAVLAGVLVAEWGAALPAVKLRVIMILRYGHD